MRMSLPPGLRRSIGLCVVTCLCLAPASQGEYTSSTVNFSGPSQSFSMNLGASGNVTVNGNGTFHLLDAGIIRSHKTISIPNQVKAVSLNTVTFSSQPVGSATIGYDNFDLSNPAIQGLNVDFLNGSVWNFAFNPIVFDVNIESIGNVGLRLDLSGTITGLSFASDPGSYSANPVYFVPGTMSVGLNARVTGVAQDVIGGVDFDLGELTNLNETETTDFDLPGLMTLTHDGPPHPSDLGVGLDLQLPINLPFGLDYAGSDSIVEGHGTGNVDLFVNYAIDADLILGNLSYALQGSIPNAVVPEASSLTMAAFAVAGMTGMVVRRRRR